jgi:hypothetical protein
MMRQVAAVLCVLPGLLLASCGGDGDEDQEDPELTGGVAGGVPECAEIDGEDMPEEFEGCEEDGQLQVVTVYDCADGRVLYLGGSVAGFVGEPTVYVAGADGSDEPRFNTMLEECRKG